MVKTDLGAAGTNITCGRKPIRAFLPQTRKEHGTTAHVFDLCVFLFLFCIIGEVFARLRVSVRTRRNGAVF